MLDVRPIDRMLQGRLAPAAVIERPREGVELARALMAGGIEVVEVMLRSEAALTAIAAIKSEVAELQIAAGTVLEPDQVDRAVDAGADFAVAPALNERVCARAQAVGLPFIPGVMTPREVELAHALGYRRLKLFPAGSIGGAAGVRALAGPYSHLGIKFMPTGGIGAANAGEFLRLPSVTAIGGSWLADSTLIATGNWERITEIAREAVAMVAATRQD